MYMTEWGQWVMRCIAAEIANLLQSWASKVHVIFRLAQKQHVETFMIGVGDMDLKWYRNILWYYCDINKIVIKSIF